MWENVCNSYIIPTPLLYSIPTPKICYFIFSISSLSQSISRFVYTRSVISWMEWPTIYLIAYSSTWYFFAAVMKCIRPSWALCCGFSFKSSRILLNHFWYLSYYFGMDWYNAIRAGLCFHPAHKGPVVDIYIFKSEQSKFLRPPSGTALY